MDQTVPGPDRDNATDIHANDANRAGAETDIAVADKDGDYSREDLNAS